MKQKSRWNMFSLVFFLIMLFVSVLPVAYSQVLTVSTDKSQYQRGEIVTVSVSGGTANGIVMIQFSTGTTVKWADQDNFAPDGTFQYQLRIPTGWALGTYTVTVKDFEADVSATDSFTVYVPAPPPPPPPPPPTNQRPVSRAGPDQTVPAERTAFFDGSLSSDSDGSIVLYKWFFGDGDSALGVKATHVYNDAGTYTVMLQVFDDDGASHNDTAVVTVLALPLTPEAGVDIEVPRDAVNYVVDALEEANASVTINATWTAVYILKYPANPYPEASLPRDMIPFFVDIWISSPDSVSWPIRVERHYTDDEVAGMDESEFGIYYYKDGAWHRCSETGVLADENIAWARMYEDEVTGSVVLIGEAPTAAAFQLSDLTIDPSEVDPGEPVTISVDVTNVGELSGSYTVTLMLNGEVEDEETVTLAGGASTTVSFTVSVDLEGTYSVEVDGLTGSFSVTAPLVPPEPEFEVSDLTVTPSLVRVGESVTVSVKVSNIGTTSGSYTVEMKVNETIEDQKTVTLGAGEFTNVVLTFSSEQSGIYMIYIDGLTEGITVVEAPPPPPPPSQPFPWMWVGVIIVIVAASVIAFFYRQRL